MDDMTALERQIGVVLGRMGGPEPDFDPMAIANQAVTTAPSGRWAGITRRLRGGLTATPTVPATNGHTPTVIGRTQSMFSPVKAITAGALVFALGGVLLIAQPFDQQRGGVPGAATDAEVAPPVEVTATSAGGPCSPATVEEDGNVVRERGYTCQSTYTWSDPRLNGAVTAGWNQDNYTDESGLSIETFALSIENDAGGWRMRPIPSVQFPDAVEVGAEVWVLDGEGEYEGLTAVLLVEGFGPHGFIIEGDLPSPPENASTK